MHERISAGCFVIVASMIYFAVSFIGDVNDVAGASYMAAVGLILVGWGFLCLRDDRYSFPVGAFSLATALALFLSEIYFKEAEVLALSAILLFFFPVVFLFVGTWFYANAAKMGGQVARLTGGAAYAAGLLGLAAAAIKQLQNNPRDNLTLLIGTMTVFYVVGGTSAALAGFTVRRYRTETTGGPAGAGAPAPLAES